MIPIPPTHRRLSVHEVDVPPPERAILDRRTGEPDRIADEIAGVFISPCGTTRETCRPGGTKAGGELVSLSGSPPTSAVPTLGSRVSPPGNVAKNKLKALVKGAEIVRRELTGTS